ncbi:hypothetical protein SS50377_23502 [Spironucleus salmonicida]|uniref:Uncharacterized protein n=1 Tax=Spironucleus salmonicida TaxID=348837 RepID=V6LNR6_9EUKA|nr:hypothetical protein SS50377_23502 [Spironucleus salmonicida]|eukprot:EST46240.1 hypothetical protein SS50377_13836 [Spironucleus salmonicida]
MPDFNALQPPSVLPFSHTPPEQLNHTFSQIIDQASIHTATARKLLLDLPNQHPGLASCAQYWIFCVKFELCASSFGLATERLNQAFSHKAQPVETLKQTQKYLNQIAIKSDFAAEILPKIEKNQVFQQSQTLMKKGAEYVENIKEDMSEYYQGREQQEKYVFEQDGREIVQILGSVGGSVEEFIGYE